MVKRVVLAFALALASSTARADAPDLAVARTAIDEARFDEAMQFLLTALESGKNPAAAMPELYRLLGTAAAALGQEDNATLYYRSWLALDEKAWLPADASPKLRASFDAAKSAVASRGGFRVSASARSDDHERALVDVFLMDQFMLAAKVAIVSNTGQVYGHTDIPPGREITVGHTDRVVVFDRYGNTLAEVNTQYPIIERRREPWRDETEPKKQLGTGFYALAIPTGLLLATGIGFGAASIVYNAKVQTALEDSSSHYYTDVADQQKKVTLFWKLAAVTGGVGLVLAIPTAILYKRSGATVLPFSDGGGGGGIAVAGRF